MESQVRHRPSSSDEDESAHASIVVRVCHSTTCTGRGSELILAAIEDLAEGTDNVAKGTCLSRCSVGPNALGRKGSASETTGRVITGLQTFNDALSCVRRLSNSAPAPTRVRVAELRHMARMLVRGSEARSRYMHEAAELALYALADGVGASLAAATLAETAEELLLVDAPQRASANARRAAELGRTAARLADDSVEGAGVSGPSRRRAHRAAVRARCAEGEGRRRLGQAAEARAAFQSALELDALARATHGRALRGREVVAIEAWLAGEAQGAVWPLAPARASSETRKLPPLREGAEVKPEAAREPDAAPSARTAEPPPARECADQLDFQASWPSLRMSCALASATVVATWAAAALVRSRCAVR